MGKIAIREGLFSEGTSGSLLGAKCKTCGHILAPLTALCCYCRGEDVEKVELSRKGKLYSYTTVYQPHPKYGKSYTVGFIDLTDGLRIFSPLKAKEGKELQVGMEMELVVEKLYDENENEVIGPKFQPI
jgi:uncharacterized OB-fold protein